MEHSTIHWHITILHQLFWCLYLGLNQKKIPWGSRKHSIQKTPFFTDWLMSLCSHTFNFSYSVKCVIAIWLQVKVSCVFISTDFQMMHWGSLLLCLIFFALNVAYSTTLCYMLLPLGRSLHVLLETCLIFLLG